MKSRATPPNELALQQSSQIIYQMATTSPVRLWVKVSHFRCGKTVIFVVSSMTAWCYINIKQLLGMCLVHSQNNCQRD